MFVPPLLCVRNVCPPGTNKTLLTDEQIALYIDYLSELQSIMLAKSLTMLTLSRVEGGSLKILTLGSERVGELGPRAQMKIK